MLLNELQLNAVKAAINERRLEIARVIGTVKDLVKDLELADAHLVAVEGKADFVYGEGLDVPEDKARETVELLNTKLTISSAAIDTDNIEQFLVDGAEDVITRLISMGG